mmetsp:Transcript_31245/g.99923  ORF Transcript_31245/g.99923 Transcript_31245/m.99923 type:complete len:247 (-) Transcript_31245:4-744(-)
MPGPLVEERVMRCTGLPRNRSGRAPSTAARAAIAFSARRSAPKETLPSPTITTPWFCARNSTCPALACCTAAATSVTTVPRFGFGISPLGPSTRAALARAGSASGVASTRSKSSRPAITSATSSSAPTRSAPAARAASASAPRAKTATRTVFTPPCGSMTCPRTRSSVRLASTFRWTSTETPSSYPRTAQARTSRSASCKCASCATRAAAGSSFLRPRRAALLRAANGCRGSAGRRAAGTTNILLC